MQDKGDTFKKNNSAALGQCPVSPSKDTHNNIFKPFYRYWNPLQVGEVKINMLCCPKACRFQNNWNLKFNAFDSYLSYQGLIRRLQAHQCLDPYHLLTHKTSPYSLWGGGVVVAGIVLEVLAYCVSSLPGKEISPFYFLLHNLLSVFLFNISV